MAFQNQLSPTGRAMNTVEILNEVISFMPLKDATRCACVCKGWLDVSLDHIWADVPGFEPLFNVLAPLSRPIAAGNGAELDAPLVFSRPITTRDWHRLTPLLRRIKSFVIDKHDGIGENHMFLDNSVFERVLFTRPSTTFMPTLRRLVIRAQGRKFDRVEQFLVVLSESVTTLDIRVLKSASVVKNLAYFMLEAAERAPNVKHISIWDACSKPVFEKHTQEVYPKFVALESVSLSSCALDATMISALSTLPSLKNIQFGWWGTNGRTEDVKSIHGAILGSDTGPPFPKLRFFTLQGQLSSVTRFLSEKFSPSALQRLSVDVISPMMVGDLSNLLQVLARTCKSLTALHILRQEDTGMVRGDTITADALRRLKDLPYLQVFTLHYAQRLDVSDRELAQIILSCRKLRSFRLSRDPLTMGKEVSTLTLDLLSMLADSEDGTTLVELYVDVDARDPPSPRPIHVQTLCLGTLSFGFSITLPDQISRVAAYLDSVLSKFRRFMLITDTSMLLNPRKSDIMGNTTKRELEGRATLWKSVSNSLELITATRRRTEEESVHLREKIAMLGKELDEVKRRLVDSTRHDEDSDTIGQSAEIDELLDSDA